MVRLKEAGTRSGGGRHLQMLLCVVADVIVVVT